MTNYKELIERLRDPNNCNVLDDVDEAANAIETLTAELAEERHRLTLGKIFREHFNLKRKRVRDGKTLYWVYVSAD